MEKLRFRIVGLFVLMLLFVFVGAAAADVSADFTINGQWASSLPNGVKTVELGDKINFEYPLWYVATDDVEWYVKYDNGVDDGEWEHLDDDYYAKLQLYITGAHQIKAKVKRWCWSIWSGVYYEYGEKTITLQHEVSIANHATKYPIFLVPGVNGFDKIDLLDFALGIDSCVEIQYFHQIANRLRQEHNQIVEDVSLSAWQNTVDRGEYLGAHILDFLLKNDPCFFDGKLKVNIIAHSHGSTTSRVAVAWLANIFRPLDPNSDTARSSSRVASLTTVAGPHFGTPTADGAFQLVAMLNEQDILENGPADGRELKGDLVWNRAKRLFQTLGVYVATLSKNTQHIGFPEGLPSNYADYYENMLQTQEFDKVGKGFTQAEMYYFNKFAYPSAGLPSGAKYVLNADDIIYLRDKYGIIVDENDLTDDYNQAYGFGALNTTSGPICDNGLGDWKAFDNPTAIRYYSFSGSGNYLTGTNLPWNLGNIGVDFDPFDMFLLIFNSFHTVVGEDFNALPGCYRNLTLSSLDSVNGALENVFKLNILSLDTVVNALNSTAFICEINALSQCMQGKAANGYDDMLDNNEPDKEGIGYTRATDSFIPVDSAHFGEYIHTFDWNHADEQNQTLGLFLAEGAHDPKVVYSAHANRLKVAGL